MAVERYRSRYGVVLHSSTCKDDHPNIISRPSFKAEPFTALTLQASAMRSIRAVERRMGGPFRPRHIRVTGSIRTCSFQAQKFREDPNRFASPNTTLHTQGLAIDVHTSFLNDKLRKSLLAHGWHQSRPVDEPWHFSFRLKA